MQPDKTMMVITGEIQNTTGSLDETFRMIPHNLDCPYNEAIYDRDRAVLFVISKEKKNNLQKIKSQKEEIIIEKYYEYQLTTHNEIHNFVNMFCINADRFDFLRYMQPK